MSDTAWFDLLRHPPVDAEDPAAGLASDDDGGGGFFAEGQLPADSLVVEVAEVGRLGWPLTDEQAQALEAISEPAAFGWREHTLYDPAVRHSGEVAADAVDLRWGPGVFAALQHEVAQALGLEAVHASLHNLLVYGSGQFFKAHQDTEKHPRMVATLVLLLPSPHQGGALCVRHGEELVELTSALADNPPDAPAMLRWFAFYADCHHEVLPVDSGWRVALTFDLMLPSEIQAFVVPDRLREAVATALRGDDQPAHNTHAGPSRPQVLLLDHEYTEHGLRWHLLKGADRWRVALLRAAAESLGWTVQLALLEHHECWSAYPIERSTRRNDRWDDYPDEDAPEEWDDEDDEEAPTSSGRDTGRRVALTEEFELNDLLEATWVLDFWVDAHNNVADLGALTVEEDEVWAYIPTHQRFLAKQAYEGYMGNYGETLDRWYRRAALVMQTPAAALRSHFLLDFDHALAELVALTHTGQATDVAEVQRRIHLFSQLLRTHRQAHHLAAFAELAAVFPDDDHVRTLLLGFTPTEFTPEDAPTLAQLERRCGTAWLQALWTAWGEQVTAEPRRQGYTRSLVPTVLWPSPLQGFTQAGVEVGLSVALLNSCFTHCLHTLARWDKVAHEAMPVARIAEQAHHHGLLLELAQAIHLLPPAQAQAQHQALIDQVLAQPVLYPLTDLAALVHTVGRTAQHWPAPLPLFAQVVQALQTALAQPARSPADGHLAGVAWTCRCGNCQPMIDWAESPSTQPLVLAMAQQQRSHVEAQIQASGVPLGTETLTRGRPYKLVLHKPKNLWQQDQQQRQHWAAQWAMLQG